MHSTGVHLADVAAHSPGLQTAPASVCSSSHVQRPGYPVRMPLTARPSLTGTAAEEHAAVAGPAQRRLAAVSQSLDTQARRWGACLQLPMMLWR